MPCLHDPAILMIASERPGNLSRAICAVTKVSSSSACGVAGVLDAQAPSANEKGRIRAIVRIVTSWSANSRGRRMYGAPLGAGRAHACTMPGG